MIIAQRKDFSEIREMVRGPKRLLILGCGTCVTVCMAGGAKEVAVLAATLRLANRRAGIQQTVEEATIERQCDREFFDPIRAAIERADAVLSMACGIGVQYAGELFPNKPVLPALNTTFYGVNQSVGVWSERCLGCGECVLDRFGGVCPIARCSKSLLNGPCGGSQDGMCEVDPQTIPCGWQLIYDRMKTLGQLDRLEINQPPKDWRPGRDGGPRTMIRSDMQP